ncbi:FAD-dependent oxidoreductase [Blastococcus sp. MG754426]|uniref:FAD-dependent oxidoreductase n=1 Tax=unclassified Blastococcus TaxID=2619396 RepID=UPI0027E18F85|nr:MULTISPECIES: FAD-dependent oxidoreductase [unclassified Blastococcus]MCF6508108.1 FAD-dependent oxidoreductase [Blastococcus sp. MG754426]MCF6511563.1 FAD-dependent oxidoreductase [Blastococcus sp. MG754427]
MRVRSDGIEDGAPQVELHHEGRPVAASGADTVASALTDAGIRACRTAVDGSARGLFCGMGVCGECAVVVDDRPGRLACLTPVREGMRVAPQPAARPLAEEAVEELEEVELRPDVLVLGAGPAGLAAAATAAEAGLRVLLVEERAKLGGQYYKQPATAFTVDEGSLDGQYRQGRALIRRVQRAGVEVLTGVRVWGAFAPDHLLAAGEDRRWVLRPRRLVIATGAFERAVPFPGWTLPGIMTTGAAQTLVRAQQVAPGTRVLVSGNGPLNLQVAADLVRAGVTVVALAEVAALPGPRAVRAGLRMLRSAPDLVRDGIGYAATLARARVPVLTSTAIVRAEGGDEVRRAVVARLDGEGRAVPGTERTFEVDAVCLGFGFLPSNEIARSLGCRHRYDAGTGALAVECGPDGRSSVDGVWVVGDAGGIAGARVAEARGALAGAAAAADLGAAVGGGLAEAVGQAERLRRRNEAFQSGLATVFRAPLLVDQLAEADTTACRCESVTLGEIAAGVAGGAGSAGALKRATRAGMGRCQGRYCTPLVTHLVARSTGTTVDEYAGFAPQAPFKPVEIGVVAEPGAR